VYKCEHVAAEATGVGHDDAKYRLRGDGGVGCSAAREEYFLAGGYREGMSGRNGAEAAT
jgi:hypothetical protein